MPVVSPSRTTHSALGTDAIDSALTNALTFGAGCPTKLADALRYAVLGPGKRLRPRLVLMANAACGGEPTEALPAACAVELIHAYSLVHDDLPAMDDDDLRRGRPTCHKAFDEATAILVGDALQARSFELLATQIHPAEAAAQCCAELARAAGAQALVGGQADDLAGLHPGATADDLEHIHARKTGAMFVVSLRLGGIVAGATATQLAALTQYGERFGLAFQITDDLLDVNGAEEAVGKRVGKDAGRGKLTYPGLWGAERSREQATALINAACAALDQLPGDTQPLYDLAQKVIHRDR
jgi:geranylgeranyl diphosphate synthase, type II